MSFQATPTLREINDKLRAAAFRLGPTERLASSFKPEELSSIVELLRQATLCLSSASRDDLDSPHPSEEGAVREYRENVEGLKRLLPSLHVRLLVEKERLEAARTRLAATHEWSETRKRGY